MIILGIETSCDETAASVYSTNDGVLSSEIFSQLALHQQFGGVMPEAASRSHLEKITPIVQQALDTAQVTLDDIDAIAVTTKPGLPGSLLVGVCFAKAIAAVKNKPIIAVNHLEGHAFSSFLGQQVPFPHLCLTASGGHTNLYLMNDFGSYSVIGQTLDDAAGEAFDKVAKFINLPYPGGPVIEERARQMGFVDFFEYPRSMSESLDFSFSGLKTAVLYDLVKRGAFDIEHKKFLRPNDELLKNQVASSLLVCIKDIFVNKIIRALKQHPEIQSVSFVGGVACNKYLRRELEAVCTKKGVRFFVPAPQYCTDNAAMIAFVGHYKALRNEFSTVDMDIF